jgi:small ligand-binding sensory domain FIST
VTVRIGVGISTQLDLLAGAAEAGDAAVTPLEGQPVDLALVFASGSHLGAAEAMLERIQGTVAPQVLVGCGASGVLGGGRELESGTAVVVWAAAFDGAGEARPFHVTVGEEDGEHVIAGLPAITATSSLIMLADPYSFPTDAVLSALAREAPGVPVLGGLSSARTPDAAGALFLDDGLCERGAVGICMDGIEMLPCVSQGATPLGREVTVTGAEGRVIYELAGRPAIETIDEIIAGLPVPERELMAAGLLIGIVIDGGKPEYEQGDFLVRGVLGADASMGAIAVGASVNEGQVVRLHVRDARSAGEDLRRALRLRAEAVGSERLAGALVFSCNGRGQAMFGPCDHDATMVRQELRGAPAAGFFAAGELGPVGWRSFLHTFTATVGVFPS